MTDVCCFMRTTASWARRAIRRFAFRSTRVPSTDGRITRNTWRRYALRWGKKLSVRGTRSHIFALRFLRTIAIINRGGEMLVCPALWAPHHNSGELSPIVEGPHFQERETYALVLS